MREYIREKQERSFSPLESGKVKIVIDDDLKDSISIKDVLNSVGNIIPGYFLDGIESIHVGDYTEFEERDVNAVYRDGKLFLSSHQTDNKDMLDDIVHEIAHHLESKYPEEIYGDKSIIDEFLRKREQLRFEIRSDGYWTDEYDFKNIKFDKAFDDFLYKRLGRKKLKSLTSGMFIRPYASVSAREYFATGFEAYYLGQRDTLFAISPVLYSKIETLGKE